MAGIICPFLYATVDNGHYICDNKCALYVKNENGESGCAFKVIAQNLQSTKNIDNKNNK